MIEEVKITIILLFEKNNNKVVVRRIAIKGEAKNEDTSKKDISKVKNILLQ